MIKHKEHHRVIWVALIGLDVFLSLGGFVGGISFITDKTGKGLQAELSWLDKSPVDDYLLPGFYILFMYALMPIVALILSHIWNRKALLINAIVGFSLIPWVVYQFIVVPETIFIQYLMISVGTAICALSLAIYSTNDS